MDWEYLTNKIQYVDFDSHISTRLPVRCGVPQGSILGSLLFLIYINDISQNTTENILSFADDTTVFLSNSNPSRLFNRANTSMDAIFNWFCANKLSLNATKTQYMAIQHQNIWFIYVQPNNWQCDSDSNNFVQIPWYNHRWITLLE